MKRWRLLPMNKVIEDDDGDYRLNTDYEELETENKSLCDALDKIHSWLVCASISPPEDMAQSFVEMEKIAREALSPEPEKDG